ncbi:hypothetical protein JVT61DRAFT_15007 [Boletus reticuloceps]|uniref:Uncharacterized protein n=1 Tax=Boletus reticuloceps TaxID=495285 RepID=A0A8I2YC51_9AGAM|nr:hypothetical protein JVT61DRAFT_15628 [Boletus reticuloceps]KAG6369360.1 hypothetical protein JVT61DRAFT_15007 [Boletus reticuloceps]
MDIARKSYFLESSFRKYQWREALSLCLATLSRGFTPKEPADIRKEIDKLTTPNGLGSHIEPKPFLKAISDCDLVPFCIKPDSIFFLSSKQNFISACFDWLSWSVRSAGKINFQTQDAKKMYTAIGRLEKATWSK